MPGDPFGNRRFPEPRTDGRADFLVLEGETARPSTLEGATRTPAAAGHELADNAAIRISCPTKNAPRGARQPDGEIDSWRMSWSRMS